MEKEENYYLFLVTVPNMEQGKKIAQALVMEKLAACVNIIPQIYSIYRWKGKIEEDNEILLLIKTNEAKSENIVTKIQELHTYETPECIGFRILKGNPNYLQWISDSIK